MKFSRIVLQVNLRRITESDFRYYVKVSRWQAWRHFARQSAATCERKRSVCNTSVVCQFQIYSAYSYLFYQTSYWCCLPAQRHNSMFATNW